MTSSNGNVSTMCSPLQPHQRLTYLHVSTSSSRQTEPAACTETNSRSCSGSHTVWEAADAGEATASLQAVLCCEPAKQTSLLAVLQVYVPSHPLVKHWLAVARNRLSPPPVFRSALAELGRLLIYEAIEQEGWLPTVDGQAETPCGTADVTFIDPSRPVIVRFSPPSLSSSWHAERRQQ